MTRSFSPAPDGKVHANSLLAATYRIKVESDGYDPQETTVAFEDVLRNRNIPVALHARRGTVKATSNPAAAAVYLDGDKETMKGQTPFTQEMDPGRHTIRFAKAGYQPTAWEEFEIQRGRQTELTPTRIAAPGGRRQGISRIVCQRPIRRGPRGGWQGVGHDAQPGDVGPGPAHGSIQARQRGLRPAQSRSGCRLMRWSAIWIIAGNSHDRPLPQEAPPLGCMPRSVGVSGGSLSGDRRYQPQRAAADHPHRPDRPAGRRPGAAGSALSATGRG